MPDNSRAIGGLRREAHALPVQLFRIVVALLAAAHFMRLLIEVGDFSAPDGLIDHVMVPLVYPETRVSLFQPGTPSIVIVSALLVALAASLCILAGWRTRTCAAIALAVAASAYRWNFIVMYLDDAVVHLMLFWLLLLPVEPSLKLTEFVREPRATLRRWSAMTVPGTAVTCLMLNVALMYVIAGVWKFDSPLWRSGYGLYAALRLPVAAMPDAWGTEFVPLLRIANWTVMAIEPFMALPMLLRPGHPLKAVGGVLFSGFHLFILVTLGLPFAMFGLLATTILFFGPEIAAAAARWSGFAVPPPLEVRPAMTRSGRLAIAFLVVLFLATSRRIPVIGALNVPAYGVLWMVGVAQDYRLFNWIDRVNFDVDTEVIERRRDGDVAVTDHVRYPTSFRSRLLLAYLHDIRWLRLPRQHRFQMRMSIALRLSSWYCENNQAQGDASNSAEAKRRGSRPAQKPNSAEAEQRRSQTAQKPNGAVSNVQIKSRIYRLVPEGREFVSDLIVADFTCRNGRAVVRETLRSVTAQKPDSAGA